MYRSRKYTPEKAKRMAAARVRGVEAGPSPGYPQELPDLRRTVLIIDYDQGQPITYRIDLYKSDRVDCYKAVVEGAVWKARVGWSAVLEGVRKSFVRVRSI